MTKPSPAASNAARQTKKPGEHSFASLNVMRGVSAAMVLFSHSAAAVGGRTPVLRFNYGSFAVDVFMLISGFLMMWHYYERGEKGESWTNPHTCLRFYVRRFFRIAPLYYFLLVLVFVFHNGLHRMEWENRQLFPLPYAAAAISPVDTQTTWEFIVSRFTFTFGFIPKYVLGVPIPDWSIGLEMQFYLFFPLLAILLVRTEFMWGAALLVLLHAVSYKLFGVGETAAPKILGAFSYPTLLPFKLDCFLAGMLLAAGLYERSRPVKRCFLLLLGLLVSGIYAKKFLLVCFLFGFYEISQGYGTGLPQLDQLVDKLKPLVESRLFKFMADASYGVYLIHLSLLILVVQGLSRSHAFVAAAPMVRFLTCFAIMLLLVYPLAFAAFKLIESPGISLGRQIVKRIR